MINLYFKVPDTIVEAGVIERKSLTKKILEFIPKKQLNSFLDYEEVKNINDRLTVERSYG